MSPEQLHDSKHVDARTDIWALGVVLHELVTGARPFEGESAAAVGAS
jgi:eukaryotic-like serine/threonine-protein kinase